MVMEHAGGGEVLEYLMKKGRLEEYVARKIFLQIVNAIHYCHSRGVVHRDLKLENVLFREDPAAFKVKSDEDCDDDVITPVEPDFFVKLIDFGIAGVCE